MYQVGQTLNHIAHLFQLTKRVKENAARLPNWTDPDEGAIIDQLAKDSEEILQRATALLELYKDQSPQATFQQLLATSNDLRKAFMDLLQLYVEVGAKLPSGIKLTYLQLTGETDKWHSRESSACSAIETQVLKLDQQLVHTLRPLADFTLESMPISVSKQISSRISYEQVRQSPQAAIQLAFVLFEEHLRQRIGAGPDLYGEDLINAAYGKNGALMYGEVAAERVGLRNLIAGFYATFRNPRMHRILDDNESTAMTAVALVDLLIQIVNESEQK